MYHNDVRAPMVYTHVLNRCGRGDSSPPIFPLDGPMSVRRMWHVKIQRGPGGDAYRKTSLYLPDERPTTRWLTSSGRSEDSVDLCGGTVQKIASLDAPRRPATPFRNFAHVESRLSSCFDRNYPAADA